MKPKSEKSIELYYILLRRGYPEGFCDEVTKNLNTDFTAQRMIGYLSHYHKEVPMFPIISKRETGVNLRKLMDLRGITAKELQAA